MNAQGLATLARWHREHHTRREFFPAGERDEIARLNLRALGKAETSEAVEAEMLRLERANNLEGCRPGFLADLGRDRCA